MAHQFIIMDLRAQEIKVSPQHEDILSNFKVQLKNQVRFTSLKVLCARKVVDSLLDYEKQGLTKLSSVLPKTLCSLVYQELLEPDKYKLNISIMRKDWCEFNAAFEQRLLLLAGDGLEELDCTMLNVERTLAEVYYQQMFKQIAEGSPKLRSLKDKNNFFGAFFEPITIKFLISDYYNLKSMSNLVILEVNIYHVKAADLLIIGLSLPLLQRLLLKFKPSFISIEALKFLTILKYLKHFTAEVRDFEDRASVLLVKNCLQLMPQVNTVGVSLRDLFVLHEFPSYQVPVELGLEHLVLGEKSAIPFNVTLPKVTRVTVFKSLTVSLKQFKKLQYLTCILIPWSQLEKAFAEVGHLVKKLKLSWEKYNLLQVLHLCPNLEALYFVKVEFLDNYNVSQLKRSIRNLKRFRHETDDREEEHFIDSRGLLHLLLTSCPDLEELLFSGIRLTKAEIDVIIEDMKNGALAIQKLQKIYILAKVEQEDYVSFAEFARKMCEQNINTLKKVHINAWLDQNVELPELNLALKMQYYINNKNQFITKLDF